MSQQVVDQYVRWFIRYVRDDALKAIVRQFRAGYVTDPSDPLYRAPYHRLLRVGVPEAAIPAVLELIIRSVDAALESALWQEDQLRTTGHLRVLLLESATAGDKPESWIELSSKNLTYQNLIPWTEESADVRTAKDLDAIVRGPAPGGRKWESPLRRPEETAREDQAPE